MESRYPAAPVLPRWLIVVAATFAVGYVVYALREVLTPVLLAFMIAYLLDPVVDRLEAWRIPRAVGIIVVLMAALGICVLFLLLVLPGIVEEMVDFFKVLPGKIEAWLVSFEPWLEARGIRVPHTLREAVDQLNIDFREVAQRAIAPAGVALGWVAGGTYSVLAAVASAVFVPVFAFYLLYDFDRLTAGVHDLIPWRMRPFIVDIVREVDLVLGQFIRGQLIVMAALAVLYGVAYSLLGIRLAIAIGIIGGLLSFIPYVGGAVALGLGLLMAAIDYQGLWQLLGVVGAYSVVQFLESFVITPRVVGDKVGLPAIWVLFALMIGGEIFGFLGILLAVPAAAVLKIFVMRGVTWYRRSAFYGHDPALSVAEDESNPIGGILHEEGLPDDPDVRASKEAARRAE